MMKKNGNNAISQNIKKYRLLNHMTQEELAKELYLDTQYYAQLERGERNFTIEKITQLCSVFHIGIENIIELETQEAEDTQEYIDKLSAKLHTLSQTQLSLLERFIDEILVYIK